jgi:hypothetical protein
MVFMVVDINKYDVYWDLILNQDGAIVDIERGLIQV